MEMILGRGRRARRGARGQALVLMVLMLTALLAAAALVIDGGNAFAQQRATQNGADAAAEAGAVALAQTNADWVSAPKSDAFVESAIAESALDNKVTIVSQFYTDIHGTVLAGNPVPGANGNSAPPAGAYGVQVTTQRSVNTFLGGVVGISTISPTTDATAIAGPPAGCVPSSGCVLLPITPQPFVSTCDGTNGLVTDGVTKWPTDGTVSIVPLCSGGPGNVGWIDWYPTAGGMPDVITSIQTPNNPQIGLPSWQYVTQTGNPNTADLETAINAYNGQAVLLPLFDATCATPNGVSLVGYTAIPDCTTQGGQLGGNGTNYWYHFPWAGSFQLCAPGLCDGVVAPDLTVHNYTQGAYINGGNAICGTGNGSTGCLVGRFLEISARNGTVDQNYGGGPLTVKTIVVNLIK